MKITEKILIEMGFQKGLDKNQKEIFIFQCSACDDPRVRLDLTVSQPNCGKEYYINTIRYGRPYSILVKKISDLFSQMVVKGIVAGYEQKEEHIKSALGIHSEKIQE